MPILRSIHLSLLTVALSASVLAADELVAGYQWIDLGQGIYVVTRDNPFAGPVDGNSTVIVNQSDVIVVDSHIDPAVARAVIARIRELTPNQVRYLINTHWHDDHTNGNQEYRKAFPEVEIVAHPATLSEMKEQWPQFLADRLANYERVADRDLLAMADELESSDPRRAMELRVYAGYREALLPELPTLEPEYPTLSTESLVLQRGARRIEIRWLGRGNTAGDLVVWLPKEKIAITGDLVVHPIPYAFDAPMGDWSKTLGKLLELGAETYVPGHGAPLAEATYIDRLVRLIDETNLAAEKAIVDGLSLEQFLVRTPLERATESFAGEDPDRRFSWESYFRRPGLESAYKEAQR